MSAPHTPAAHELDLAEAGDIPVADRCDLHIGDVETAASARDAFVLSLPFR